MQNHRFDIAILLTGLVTAMLFLLATFLFSHNQPLPDWLETSLAMAAGFWFGRLWFGPRANG